MPQTAHGWYAVCFLTTIHGLSTPSRAPRDDKGHAMLQGRSAITFEFNKLCSNLMTPFMAAGYLSQESAVSGAVC